MWLSNNQNTILQPAALGAKKKKKKGPGVGKTWERKNILKKTAEDFCRLSLRI